MNTLKTRYWFAVVGLVLTFTLLIACSQQERGGASASQTAVTLQLKWVHQAQFAGYYVADDLGYFADAGLDVTFIEGGVGISVLDALLSGQADFAVWAPEHILLHRSLGEPLVVIATIYQRNPLVLISKPQSNIFHPVDLANKTLAVGNLDAEIQVAAMLRNVGMTVNDVTIVPYDPSLADFEEGLVDVVPAFAAGSLMTMEPDKNDFNYLWPLDYGVEIYSDTIITTEKMVQENPDLVARFVAAVLRGHRFVIENPEAAVESSMKYAPDADRALQKNMIDASLPLIHTGTDPIGWSDLAVWSSMQDVLLSEGFLTQPVALDELVDSRFVEMYYDTE